MENTFTKIFADTLRDILRIKGISQVQLASKLGVKQNTMSQWVNGKREPNYENLLKICYYLDITPDEILNYHRAKTHIESIEKIKEDIKDNLNFSNTIIDDIIKTLKD